MSHLLPSIRRRVLDWPDSVAVEWTARLCVEVLELELGDLSHLRRLDELGRALAGALAVEAELEAADLETGADAVRTQARLRQAVLPRVEDVAAAQVRAEVRLQFDAWADPYASDPTGRAHLDAMARRIDVAAPGVRLQLGALARAVADMRDAGERHSCADRDRRAGITRRLAARDAWNRTVTELLSTLDPDATQRLRATLPAVLDPGFDEAGWFDDAPSP